MLGSMLMRTRGRLVVEMGGQRGCGSGQVKGSAVVMVGGEMRLVQKVLLNIRPEVLGLNEFWNGGNEG